MPRIAPPDSYTGAAAAPTISTRPDPALPGHLPCAAPRALAPFNRGHFDRALGAAMESAARCGQPLLLAILDVDHFKQINEILGHALGDRTLCQMAQWLSRAMRRTDVVARHGVEEFLILLPRAARRRC